MVTAVFPGFGNSRSRANFPSGGDPASTPLPGLSITVNKKPEFKTRIKESSSGKEVRTSYAQFPRWTFELSYDFLEDVGDTAKSSLQTIMGFFCDQYGSFGEWLFKDPDDYIAELAVLGTGDGTSTRFYFNRYLGTVPERVGQVDTTNTVTVFSGNTEVVSGYTITDNYVDFAAAPSAGAVIRASFQFFYVCRFTDDMQDYEKFLDKLWNLQSCEFKSILV